MIIKPSVDIEDNKLYKSPTTTPLRVYSYERNFGVPVDSNRGWDYATRVYIYPSHSFSETRPNEYYNDWVKTYEQIDIPNGTYEKKFSDYDFNNGNGYIDVELLQGTYILEYVLYTRRTNNEGVLFTQNIFSCYYTIGVVENHYPLKKWTITDVINRVFDTIEPLRYGQKPRFRLQGVIYDDVTGNAIGYEEGSIADKLDKILSPEFAFTKMNLREMLQQIGGYIHGEPRIVDTIIENDGIYFIVSFDKLGGDKKAYP